MRKRVAGKLKRDPVVRDGTVATIVATVYFEWNVYLSRVIT